MLLWTYWRPLVLESPESSSALQDNNPLVKLFIITYENCNNSISAFEALNEGFAAGTVAKAEIDIETDWEDWTWPAGNYPIEVGMGADTDSCLFNLNLDSCGYDCDDQHGTYFSRGYGSFQITGSN